MYWALWVRMIFRWHVACENGTSGSGVTQRISLFLPTPATDARTIGRRENQKGAPKNKNQKWGAKKPFINVFFFSGLCTVCGGMVSNDIIDNCHSPFFSPLQNISRPTTELVLFNHNNAIQQCHDMIFIILLIHQWYFMIFSGIRANLYLSSHFASLSSFLFIYFFFAMEPNFHHIFNVCRIDRYSHRAHSRIIFIMFRLWNMCKKWGFSLNILLFLSSCVLFGDTKAKVSVFDKFYQCD